MRANPALHHMLGYPARGAERSQPPGGHPPRRHGGAGVAAERRAGGTVRELRTGEAATCTGTAAASGSSVSIALVRDPHGAPRYYVAQVMDVTDRRQAEEQLRRLAQLRPPDRPGKPALLPAQAGGGAGRPCQRPRRPALPGLRRFQVRQRHPGPPGRRRPVEVAGPGDDRASWGAGAVRPPGRRRVRRAGAGRRRLRGRGPGARICWPRSAPRSRPPRMPDVRRPSRSASPSTRTTAARRRR